MSKTMDNDWQQETSELHILRTQVETLSDLYKAEFERGYNTRVERDALKQRVEELAEGLRLEIGHHIRAAKERDNLRTSADLAISAAEDFEKQNDALHARVEELECHARLGGSMLSTVTQERDALRAELEQAHNSIQEMSCRLNIEPKQPTRHHLNRLESKMPGDSRNKQYFHSTTISTLEAENARLKAELSALKPVPVVKTQLAEVYPAGFGYRVEGDEYANVRFTFTDNVLTASEVLR